MRVEVDCASGLVWPCGKKYSKEATYKVRIWAAIGVARVRRTRLRVLLLSEVPESWRNFLWKAELARLVRSVPLPLSVAMSPFPAQQTRGHICYTREIFAFLRALLAQWVRRDAHRVYEVQLESQ